jgi:hypothetical protein
MLVADLEPYMVDGLEMTRDHVAARPPDLMREAIRLMREALSLMREAIRPDEGGTQPDEGGNQTL